MPNPKQILARVDTHGKTVMSTIADENKLEFHFSDGTFFRINLTTPTLKCEEESVKLIPERAGAKSTGN